MEVDLITAAGDGLGPAVLLSLGTRLKAQYLFNVPEGFSRFVLEHKLRPGLGLRAVFCPNLLALTGLPGLLMRLRGEGHGQVEVLGPSGTLPYVSSLRHFVHWKHPAVLVSEEYDPRQQRQGDDTSAQSPPLKRQKNQKPGNDEEISEDEYNDEHLVVKFIWVENVSNSTSSSSVRVDWKPPDWLFESLGGSAVNGESPLSNTNAESSSSSSSDSSDSESGTSESTDDSSSTSEDSETSSSDEEEKEEKSTTPATATALAAAGENDAMFASLDAAFVKGGGAAGSSRLRTQALGLLKSSDPSQKPVKTGKVISNSVSKRGVGGDSSSGGNGRLLSVLAALEKTAVPNDPTRREVGGRLYTRCEADSISLFARERSKDHQKIHQQNKERNYNSGSLGGRGNEPASSSLVAFLCLLKASNQVLLILHCTNEEQIRQVHAHPAVRAMTHLPLKRRAGCIIMLGPGLSHQQPAQDLFSTLQQHQQQATLPSKSLSFTPTSLFIVEQPGIACRSSNLGYISSARMAARLNMVSQCMFPLPIPLKSQQHSLKSNSHVPPPPPVPPQKEKEIEEEEERKNSHFYIQKLTKIVWIDGKPLIQTKVDKGEEGKIINENLISSAGAVTPARDDINVEELQSSVHEADSELKLKLEQLSESLPFEYRNQMVNSAKGETGVAEKSRQEETEMDTDGSNSNNNKSAAAALQAKLRHNTNGNAPDTAIQFKPPPPPNPPPPPPPPPPPGAPSSISQEPEVIFLGTGSAEPSQHRGASAIYLNTGHGHAGFLLDCGEGCYGQLIRFHGPQGAGVLISNLSGIWISHRHADHMSGILQILAHYPTTAPPLLLIGPRSLHAWLSESTPALGLSHRYTYAHCTEVQQPHHWAFHRICSSLGLLNLSTVPVRHCSDAFGIVLRHRTGWTVVYSGDTEPSEALVRAGSGATLLIHEATFEPLLVTEARKKRHSTSFEAMDVARRMGSYRTVLTHFSQRYPKFPEGVAEAVAAGIERGEGSSVGVAFDGMCLPLGLLPHLPAVTVAVEAVLAAAALASEKEKNLE